jgi:hypothetical protein
MQVQLAINQAHDIDVTAVVRAVWLEALLGGGIGLAVDGTAQKQRNCQNLSKFPHRRHLNSQDSDPARI